MFTFGYKTKFNSVLRALAAVAIGLVMVLGSNAPITVVKIVASCLCAAGIVSLVYGIVYKKGEMLSLMATNAFVDVALGLLLFFFPEQVAGFIVYGIGIVLIFFGALQLIVLAGAMSLVGAGFASLVLSICAIAGGAFLLFNPFTMRVMGIISGCLLILYGIAELFSTWQVGRARKVYEIKFAPKPQDTPKEPGAIDSSGIDAAREVDYHKVEDTPQGGI